VNVANNPLLEVDQKWIVRGDVSHGGKWDNGARFIETGVLTNQQWWGRVFDRLGKQDVIFEMKDIVLSSNFFHNNWGWFNAARVIEDAAHDCTYTFDRCLISIIRDLGWPYPNLVAYNSGTGEQGLTTVNILNTVVSGNTTPGSRNSLIQPYFTQNPGVSHGGKGNTAHNFVGSTFYNRRGGHITLQNNDLNISGCIIVSRGSNAERFLNNAAASRNISAVDNIFSNSQSYEEYSLGTDHTNCTFDVNFNYDGSVKSGQVSFVSSTYGSNLDFRLVPDLDNLAVKYMTSGELPYKDITGYKRPGGTDQRDAGAYQSISDKVTVKNIGTSSADFTPDYATVPLWNNTYFNNANILNGETNVIKLKSGESHDITSRVILDGNADVNQNFVISGQTPHYGDWALGASLSPGYGSTFQIDHFKNSFKVKLEDLTYSSVTGMPLYGIVGAVNFTYGFRNADDTPWRTISSKHEYEFENCMFRMDNSQGGNVTSPIVYSRHYARITDSDGNLIERGEVHHTHRNCVFIGTGSDGLGIFVNQYGSTDTKQVAQVIGCTIVNSTIATGGYMSPGKFEGSAIGSLIYLDPSLISFRNAPKGLFDFAETFSFPNGLPIYAIDCISNRATSSTFTEPHIGDPKYIVYSDTDLDTTNISYEVPFNFDGSVSAGTVSFVDGSSGVNNYRLVGSEDNFASGYVSSFNLSGLDLAGNDRGDSPYDAGAFAITLQQVEDFLKSLGGPLVLQVGYRISNNRQGLNIGGGGE
jgi:hypothetical protein